MNIIIGRVSSFKMIFVISGSEKIITQLFAFVFILALAAFGLDASEGGNVELFDQYHTPISEDSFGTIISQFKNCGHFYINFILSSDENTNFDVVSKNEYIYEI